MTIYHKNGIIFHWIEGAIFDRMNTYTNNSLTFRLKLDFCCLHSVCMTTHLICFSVSFSHFFWIFFVFFVSFFRSLALSFPNTLTSPNSGSNALFYLLSLFIFQSIFSTPILPNIASRSLPGVLRMALVKKNCLFRMSHVLQINYNRWYRLIFCVCLHETNRLNWGHCASLIYQ